jgi:predicted amidophosphoribosyltransferase
MDLTGAFGRPLAKAGGRLADLIVPHQCVLCRRFAETTGLCTACWEDLAPIAAPVCERCGLPSARATLQDRPVLLIDDVMTTGATLGEAARRLEAAGSGDVSALMLARVTRPQDA